MSDDDHGHAHYDTPAARRPRSEMELRTMALEAALVQNGVVATDAIDEFVDYLEHRIGPHHGARVVARAWTDAAFRERLLHDGTAAIAELGISGPEGNVRVVANSADVHSVAAFLCGCGEHHYFGTGGWSGTGRHGNFSEHWVDGVFGRPLGAPVADAAYDAATGTWSRRFATGTRVTFNAATSKGSIVCAWTALGPCTRENGALTLLPGSHWRGLRAHGYPDWEGEKNIAYFGIRDLDDAEIEARQHIEMDAGDCCFFHPEAIHAPGETLSR